MSDSKSGRSEFDRGRETALEFVEAIHEKEFDKAVEMFDDEAADVLLEKLEDLGPLGNDPEFTLRRFRLAARALFGPIESVSVEATNQDDDATAVTAVLHCENDSKRLQVDVDGEGNVVDIDPLDEYSPPKYVDEESFDEWETTIDSGDVELGATVAMPTDDGDSPMAVLVPGAGENDRNYEVGPNQFFRDIAWGLATRGIATLRYDKRQVVTDTPPGEMTLETEYFEDGAAALEGAFEVDGIDSDAVFVVGHSRGGMCAYEIARRGGDVAGVAALDPQTRKPLEADVERFEELLEIDGRLPPSVDELREQYQETQRRFHEGEYDQDEELMFHSAAHVESFWEYDQLEVAESLSCPLFLCQLRGMHRTPDEKTDDYEAVFGDGDTVVEYPDVNHSFQRGENPRSILEAFVFNKNADERVVEDIADWIERVSV